MKTVRYVGAWEADLVTIGLHVKPGDIIEVPDTFESASFIPVKNAPTKAAPSNSDAIKAGEN